MIDINHLEFFNIDGYNLNFKLIDAIWRGTLLFPKTSHLLYENTHIYIFDTLYKNGNRVFGQIQHNQNHNITLRYYFKNPNTPFKCYSINNSLLTINNVGNQIDIDLDNIYVDNNGLKEYINYKSNGHKLDLLVNGEINEYQETEYNDTLIIELYNESTDETQIIANVDCYCEIIQENEKLSKLLNNFSEDLNQDEKDIFYYPNTTHLELVNNKRKEKLIELGKLRKEKFSYNSLIYALKFYGYDFLKIRQYWKLVDDTFILVDILSEVYNDINGFKTNFLQLYYPIIEAVPNEFNIDGTPKVEENFIYLDDVLIKLWGLKNVLEYKYLPHNVKIIDINAEFNYFNSVSTYLITLKTRIDTFNVGENIIINKLTNNEYIDVIGKYLINVTEPTLQLNQTIENIEDDLTFNYINIHNMILNGKINTLLNNDFVKIKESLLSFYDNKETNLIGVYNELSITIFKQLVATDLISVKPYPNLYLKQLLYFGVNEIEWKISNNNYNWSIRDSIENLHTIKYILPKHGQYNLTITLFFDNGFNQIFTFDNYINVKSYNISCWGWHKDYYTNLTPNDLTHIKAKDIVGNGKHIKTVKNKIKRYPVQAFNLDMYQDTDLYTAKNLENAKLSDLKHLKGDFTKFKHTFKGVTPNHLIDIPAINLSNISANEFKRYNVYNNQTPHGIIFQFNDGLDGTKNYIEIDDVLFDFDGILSTDITTINNLIGQLEDTFKQYRFTPIWDYDNDTIVKLNKLLFRRKIHGDMNFNMWTHYQSFEPKNNGKLIYYSNNENIILSPTPNNVTIRNFETIETVKCFTMIFFSLYQTNVKYKSYKWTLKINNETMIFNTEYFNYLFTKRGSYELSCSVYDDNNNIISTKYPKYIKII